MRDTGYCALQSSRAVLRVEVVYGERDFCGPD
jgi:hypothetical protein